MKVQLPPAKALGYRQITGLSSVKSLTDGVGIDTDDTGIPAGAAYALIEADGEVVRWTDDGQNPTTTKGMRLGAGGQMVYEGDLTALRFIEEGASATLNVSFYRDA